LGAQSNFDSSKSSISPKFLYIVEISFCLDQNIWRDLGVNKIASPMGKIKGNLEKWISSIKPLTTTLLWTNLGGCLNQEMRLKK